MRAIDEWGEGEISKILVNYFNVGQLPPYKAMQLIADLNENWKPIRKQLEKQGVAFVNIPVRNQITKMELISVENGLVYNIDVGQLSPSKIEAMIDRVNEYWAPVRKQLKNQGVEINDVPTRGPSSLKEQNER